MKTDNVMDNTGNTDEYMHDAKSECVMYRYAENALLT